jgi:hypothetical protein
MIYDLDLRRVRVENHQSQIGNSEPRYLGGYDGIYFRDRRDALSYFRNTLTRAGGRLSQTIFEACSRKLAAPRGRNL